MGGSISSLFGWIFGTQSQSRVHNVEEATSNNGAFQLYPPLGPNPDTPHPVTGITPRQARAVLVTWNFVRPESKKHGILIFIKLFKKYPVTQSLFRAFKDVDPETLYENKQIAAHGSTVMAAISSVVDNLDDSDTLCEILKTTGRNHKNRGIKKEYFEYVKVVILEYLSENLGKHWSTDAAQGWEAALTAINKVVFIAYALDDE